MKIDKVYGVFKKIFFLITGIIPYDKKELIKRTEGYVLLNTANMSKFESFDSYVACIQQSLREDLTIAEELSNRRRAIIFKYNSFLFMFFSSLIVAITKYNELFWDIEKHHPALLFCIFIFVFFYSRKTVRNICEYDRAVKVCSTSIRVKADLSLMPNTLNIIHFLKNLKIKINSPSNQLFTPLFGEFFSSSLYLTLLTDYSYVFPLI